MQMMRVMNDRDAKWIAPEGCQGVIIRPEAFFDPVMAVPAVAVVVCAPVIRNMILSTTDINSVIDSSVSQLVRCCLEVFGSHIIGVAVWTHHRPAWALPTLMLLALVCLRILKNLSDPQYRAPIS